MLSPKKIQYNKKTNFSFPTFDLLCDLAFDNGDNGESTVSLNRSIVSSESYNGKLHYATGSKYDETLAPKITLIKSDYTDLTPDEQRQILSWLTSKTTPGFMDVYDDPDSNAITYSLLGLPTEINAYKLTNNRTIGITFIFECLSPFAFSPLHRVVKTINSPENIMINCFSDDYEAFVYPKITIENNGKIIEIPSETFFDENYIENSVYKYNNQYYWKKDGQSYPAQNADTSGISTTAVYIYNETTGLDALTIGNNGVNETIVVDGTNKTISSSNSLRVFGDDFSWNWIGLKYGTNIISVIGNCKIILEWREPIKIGELV